jgi:putative ABC transport system permease protein
MLGMLGVVLVSALDLLGMSLRAIARNTVRSMLTALGVVIGVGSVIAMVHLGQAATLNVTQQIANMGSNLLIVRTSNNQRSATGRRQPARPFTVADVQAIAEAVDGALAAPVITSNVTVVYGNANHPTSITGTTPDYFTIRLWTLASGRLLEDRDITAGAPVCVLGQTVAAMLYGREDPLGTSLRVGKMSCQVVGLLAKKGESMGEDQDDTIIMPLKAVQRRLLGRDDVTAIHISALEDGSSARVKADVEALLRQRRRVRAGEDDSFMVRDMQELAATLESTSSTLTALLGAIAAVSLLVGGIGIMNIMLVSVTERTREIGTRLAIGALASDVLTQFLVEAVIVSMIGGLVGVGFGVGGTWLLTREMQLPFVIDYQILGISFGFSALVGVVFGYAPARKAARLSPIESLRHE